MPLPQPASSTWAAVAAVCSNSWACLQQQLFGVDADWHSLAEHRLPDLPRAVAETSALPLAAAQFDVALGSWLFEHLGDTGANPGTGAPRAPPRRRARFHHPQRPSSPCPAQPPVRPPGSGAGLAGRTTLRPCPCRHLSHALPRQQPPPARYPCPLQRPRTHPSCSSSPTRHIWPCDRRFSRGPACWRRICPLHAISISLVCCAARWRET